MPVAEEPPRTEVGNMEIADKVIGLMVSVAVTEAPPAVAVMVGVDPVVDATVLTVNVAVLDPAGTVTVAGTVALVPLEASVTTVPPVGAALEIVTVAVEEFPAISVFGDSERPVAVIRLRTLLTMPDMIGAPQPDAVSQPTPAVEVWPLGRVPFVPETTSKNTLESPFQE